MKSLVILILSLALALGLIEAASTRRTPDKTYTECYDDDTCSNISEWDYYDSTESYQDDDSYGGNHSPEHNSELKYNSDNSYKTQDTSYNYNYYGSSGGDGNGRGNRHGHRSDSDSTGGYYGANGNVDSESHRGGHGQGGSLGDLIFAPAHLAADVASEFGGSALGRFGGGVVGSGGARGIGLGHAGFGARAGFSV